MKYSINIGGREIPLQFNMPEFMEIEETIGSLTDISEKLTGGDRRIRNIITTIRIMGNAGLKAAGEKPDLTDAWLTEHMEPMRLAYYQKTVINCMSGESASEAQAEENENTERDLVLEEIEQKKGHVNSHTGG